MKLAALCFPPPRKVLKMLIVMKCTVLLILIACVQVSAKGYSQSITISAQNASLESVLKKIEKQSGYVFLYRDEWMQLSKKVNIDVKNVSLDQALNLCFKDQPLTYSII